MVLLPRAPYMVNLLTLSVKCEQSWAMSTWYDSTVLYVPLRPAAPQLYVVFSLRQRQQGDDLLTFGMEERGRDGECERDVGGVR
jgi:hypothetical protein